MIDEAPTQSTEPTMDHEVHTTTAKAVNGLMYFALGVISVGIAFVLYWTFTGNDVLTINNEPVPVKPKVAKSEEVVNIEVNFCKHSNAPGIVTRKLVSKQTELLAPTTEDKLGPICVPNAIVPIPIPPQTPVGTYKVVYEIEYRPNPLKTVVETFSSEEFQVVE